MNSPSMPRLGKFSIQMPQALSPQPSNHIPNALRVQRNTSTECVDNRDDAQVPVSSRVCISDVLLVAWRRSFLSRGNEEYMCMFAYTFLCLHVCMSYSRKYFSLYLISWSDVRCIPQPCFVALASFAPGMCDPSLQYQAGPPDAQIRKTRTCTQESSVTPFLASWDLARHDPQPAPSPPPALTPAPPAPSNSDTGVRHGARPGQAIGPSGGRSSFRRPRLQA